MEEINPIIKLLFIIFIVFLALNIITNVILLYRSNKKIYKTLSGYWISVILIFALVSYFQNGNLTIILSYAPTIIPVFFLSSMVFEPMSFQFPFKKFSLVYLATCILTIPLDKMGLSFTITATPVSIMLSIPLITAILVVAFSKKEASPLLKIFTAFLFVVTIHVANFAIFRMEPNAQIWGWSTSFVIYQIYAMMLPALTLEELHQTEQKRLKKLVKIKTYGLVESNQNLQKSFDELTTSSNGLEILFKTLVHDLATPLTVVSHSSNMLLEKLSENKKDKLTAMIKRSADKLDEMLSFARNKHLVAARQQEVKHNSRMKKEAEIKRLAKEQSQEVMSENPPKKSKQKYKIKTFECDLVPVDISECFEDIAFTFAVKLEKKRVTLRFVNNLNQSTKVLAEKTAIINSVLNNFISNSIKFSFPNEEIVITASEVDDQILLEVNDNGVGIPGVMLEKIQDSESIVTTEGTDGEAGNGLGFSLAQSYIASFGGRMEINSKCRDDFPTEHGTKVKIFLQKGISADLADGQTLLN